ncbi:MAG: carbamoyltransferase C-terminal domain-containing protein [Polyangiales bacterium]
MPSDGGEVASRGLRGLGVAPRNRVVFTEHHVSHAASAFFPSPFDEAAVMTMDGVGEWATSSIGRGAGNALELLAEQRFPHSLGLLYSAFTYYAGFRVNSGEYKLMGLAPYGEPRYVDLILERLVDLRPDGSFRLDMRYFDYCAGLTMTSARFDALFGGPPRPPEAPTTQREMDLAASIQEVTDRIVLASARHAHALTGCRDLCLAGGVALNCVSNGRLLREGPFERVWVQPAAGDAGGALGVATYIWHALLGHPRAARPEDGMRGALLGPSYSTAEAAATLRALGAVFEVLDDEGALLDRVAAALADGAVVGWFQGRMEFGPRALGGRSILADPRDEGTQSRLNLKTKFRESFRPFAPSVLAERAHEWFDLAEGVESPYMLLVAPVAASRRLPVDETLFGLERLHQRRSSVPAVTHVDGSARVQTVTAARNGRYRRLLERFHAHTGCPLVVNTSFNVRGEPIVRSPEDAYRCFMATDLDVLVVEDCVLLKSAQPERARVDAARHLSRFALD